MLRGAETQKTKYGTRAAIAVPQNHPAALSALSGDGITRRGTSTCRRGFTEQRTPGMRATLESHCYVSVTGTAGLELLPQKCSPKSCPRLKPMTPSSHLFLSRMVFLIFLHPSLLRRPLIVFDALLDLFQLSHT